jgi:hypothetical protein
MAVGRIVVAAILGMAIAAPGVAFGASVSAVLFGVSDTPAGVSPGTNTLNISFDGQAATGAYVGQLNWHTATSADWNAGLNGRLQSILGPNATFATYCIDVSQDVNPGQYGTWEYGVVPLDTTPRPGSGMGASTGAQVTEFWNRNYDQIGLDNMRASAFQLGLWELINDGLGSDPFGSGSFQASGSIPEDTDTLNLAGQWLNDLGSGKPYTNDYTVYTLSDGTIQDQVFAVRSTPLPAALPSGILALAAAATGACFRRRRVA